MKGRLRKDHLNDSESYDRRQTMAVDEVRQQGRAKMGLVQFRVVFPNKTIFLSLPWSIRGPSNVEVYVRGNVECC